MLGVVDAKEWGCDAVEIITVEKNRGNGEGNKCGRGKRHQNTVWVTGLVTKWPRHRLRNGISAGLESLAFQVFSATCTTGKRPCQMARIEKEDGTTHTPSAKSSPFPYATSPIIMETIIFLKSRKVRRAGSTINWSLVNELLLGCLQHLRRWSCLPNLYFKLDWLIIILYIIAHECPAQNKGVEIDANETWSVLVLTQLFSVLGFHRLDVYSVP